MLYQHIPSGQVPVYVVLVRQKLHAFGYLSCKQHKSVNLRFVTSELHLEQANSLNFGGSVARLHFPAFYATDGTGHVCN